MKFLSGVALGMLLTADTWTLRAYGSSIRQPDLALAFRAREDRR